MDKEMEKFLVASIIHAELCEIDQRFKNDKLTHVNWLFLLKNSFSLISNLYEFEGSIRSMYADHPSLSQNFKDASENFKFAKYLRNKQIGHTSLNLMSKVLEWKPEIAYMIDNAHEIYGAYLINIYILETGINTYVDQNGNHKIFESDTDLLYPPDFKRFINFLETVMGQGIEFSKEVAYSIQTSSQWPDPHEPEVFWERAERSASCDFKYLKK